MKGKRCRARMRRARTWVILQGHDATLAFFACVCRAPVCRCLPALAQQDPANLGSQLLQDAAIKIRARQHSRGRAADDRDQISVCEVEAPPFKETKRGEVLAQAVPRSGPAERPDRQGRQRARRAAGRAAAAAPGVHRAPRHRLSRGHRRQRQARGHILRGPGIGDDCRGLAVLLAVVRDAEPGERSRRRARITFVGTVGEEGLGDLRGVKHLFNETLKGTIDRFVSIDGTGLGITHVGRRQPALSRHLQGPGRSQLRRVRHVESDPRARPRDGARSRTSRCRASRRPRSTSAASAAARRSTRFRSRRGWKWTCARPIPPRSRPLDAKFHKAVDDAALAEDARWESSVLTVDKAAGRRSSRRRHQPTSPIVRAAVVGDARAGAAGVARRRVHRFEHRDEPRHSGHHHRRRRPRQRRARARRGVRHRPIRGRDSQRALLLCVALAQQ